MKALFSTFFKSYVGLGSVEAYLGCAYFGCSFSLNSRSSDFEINIILLHDTFKPPFEVVA